MIALKSPPVRLREKSFAPAQPKRNDSPSIPPEEDRARDSLVLDPWKIAIARLTKDEMKKLSRHELIHVVIASRVFSGRSWVDQLGLMDRDGLELLALLVRQSCRRDVNDLYRRRAQPIPCWNDA